MKFTTFLFSIFCFSITLFSKPIDSNTANLIANSFLKNKIQKLKKSALNLELHHISVESNQLNLEKTTTNLFYIFNFLNSDGFIIVAADDRVNPILGYSSEKDFDISKAPQPVLSWLNRCNEQITRIISDDNSPIHPEWEEIKTGKKLVKSGNLQVLPLLKTNWDQYPFYNDSCPKDPVSKSLSVTGCVATAMAQTLKFWNYPPQALGSNQYRLPGFGMLKADFSKSKYNWSNMANSINSSNPSIALLMKDCGLAVNMQYSSIGSGAWVSGRTAPTAEYALINNFGYSNSMTSKLKDSYTDAAWISLLKAEFDSSRVVIYYGYTSDLLSGHCFVADGYDANNFIHINWGWGGYANGYFNVSALTPSTSYNFSTQDGAIFGIKPATCSDGLIGNSEICLGSTSNLKSTITGGAWISSDPQTANVTSDGIVTAYKIGAVTITYNLPVSSTCFNNTSFSKLIKIVGAPVKPLSILGDSTLCQFETKQYSVGNSIYGNWSSFDAKINVFSDGRVQGISAGKSKLTFNYGNVCYYDTINKWINVKAAPTLGLIKGLDSLCVNSTAQYTNSVTGGIWSILDINSSISTSGLLKGLAGGKTIVVYSKKGTNGCTGKVSKTIKINTIPNPVIQGPDSLCLNSTTLYNASLPNGTWTTLNSNLTNTKGNIFAKTVGSSGVKYALTVNGCSNTVVKNIIIKALPTIGTISGPTSFCGALTAAYTASVKGGVWNISNTPIFGISQSGTITSNNTVNSSAVITYTTNAKNCSNSISKAISVVAIPNATITGKDILIEKQQVAFVSSSTGGVWSVSDNHLTITSTGLVTAVSANTSIGTLVKYTIIGTGVCAGKTTIATKNVSVLPANKVIISSVSALNIYPNPTSGIIYVGDVSKVSRIVLVDLSGRVLQDDKIDTLTNSVDYSNFNNGNYFLLVTSEDNTVLSIPIIIQ